MPTHGPGWGEEWMRLGAGLQSPLRGRGCCTKQACVSSEWAALSQALTDRPWVLQSQAGLPRPWTSLSGEAEGAATVTGSKARGPAFAQPRPCRPLGG